MQSVKITLLITYSTVAGEGRGVRARLCPPGGGHGTAPQGRSSDTGLGMLCGARPGTTVPLGSLPTRDVVCFYRSYSVSLCPTLVCVPSENKSCCSCESGYAWPSTGCSDLISCPALSRAPNQPCGYTRERPFNGPYCEPQNGGKERSR